MSERPEVKRTADKIAEAILGKSIMDLRSKTIKDDVKQKIIGSKVLSADTYGKNILISFSRNVYLRNHMMMKIGTQMLSFDYPYYNKEIRY
jgi:formamidopyrimidine-DNA glycosylase